MADAVNGLVERGTPPLGQEYQLSDEEFRLFSELIREKAGIHLSEHKHQLLRARLSRRLRALDLCSFEEYYDYLMGHDATGQEMLIMVNCITTNKTEFFREPHHFDFLQEVARQALIERARRTGNRQVRIWSAGCASGEEPYSIAISLREALGSLFGWEIEILASDIDTEVLEKAERGIYPLAQVSAIPQALLHKYFRGGTGTFQGFVRVCQEIQGLVSFLRINLLDDPWPIQARFDAIFCRNVMIYFHRSTQKRLVERFAASLEEGGHLFVGHSESLFGLSDYL